MTRDRLGDFVPGERVQAHPGTDTWMRGDRYGTVQKTVQRNGRRCYRVLMDRSGRAITFAAHNLIPVKS